ncbi:unnamed protein product [Nesidiocoris tenuis]|uniref:Uncharacterized protein n=1 Tax=Nesidiocoris tenuis TaxID=355587 RepID=A0A6H5H3F8_9HEMI|nr:unnamed protein product [Nesidiocoris tenuis]
MGRLLVPDTTEINVVQRLLSSDYKKMIDFTLCCQAASVATLENRMLQQENVIASVELRTAFSLYCVRTETALVHLYLETLAEILNSLVSVQISSHSECRIVLDTTFHDSNQSFLYRARAFPCKQTLEIARYSSKSYSRYYSIRTKQGATHQNRSSCSGEKPKDSSTFVAVPPNRAGLFSRRIFIRNESSDEKFPPVQKFWKFPQQKESVISNFQFSTVLKI